MSDSYVFHSVLTTLVNVAHARSLGEGNIDRSRWRAIYHRLVQVRLLFNQLPTDPAPLDDEPKDDLPDIEITGEANLAAGD